MNDDRQLEQRLNDLNLNAPRVRVDDLEAEVLTAQFHVFPGTMLTVCCLTLRNGFNVVGESACASPENFNADVGQDLARKDAMRKLWPLLGFRLKDRLQAA